MKYKIIGKVDLALLQPTNLGKVLADSFHDLWWRQWNPWMRISATNPTSNEHALRNDLHSLHLIIEIELLKTSNCIHKIIL